MPQAIIVGAGVGGLVTAGLLNQKGWSVTVLEASDRLGGRCSQDKDGFDIGASMVFFRREIERIMAAAGVQSPVPLVRTNPAYVYRLADGQDFDFTQASFERVSPGSWENWMAFREEALQKRDDMLEALNIRTSLTNLAPTTAFRVLASFIPPMVAMARRYFTNETLIGAVTCHTGFLGSFTGDRLSSIGAGLLGEAFDHGTYYPSGPLGMGEIPAALARALPEGSVHLNKRVLRVLPGVGALCVDGSFYRGSVIVSNVPYLAGTELLKSPPRPAEARDLTYSFSAVMFYLQLKPGQATPPGLTAANTVVASPGSILEKGFQNLPESLEAYLDDPYIYLQAPGFASESGKGKVVALCVYPNLAQHPAGASETDVERLRVAVLRHLGVEDVESSRVLTPQGWERQHGLPHGSILGPTFSAFQSIDFRPRQRWQRGLYRVGASTHVGMGVPTVMVSAEHCASQILEDCAFSPLLDTVRVSSTFDPCAKIMRSEDARARLRYLYAVFRLLDDLVDEAPGVEFARQIIAQLKDEKQRPEDAGLALVWGCGIPAHVWDMFSEALELDASGTPPPSLDWYAERVAGVVCEAMAYAVRPGREMGEHERKIRRMGGATLQRLHWVRDFNLDRTEGTPRYITSLAEAHRQRSIASSDAKCVLHELQFLEMDADERTLMETMFRAYEAAAYKRSRVCAAVMALLRRRSHLALYGSAVIAFGLAVLL